MESNNARGMLSHNQSPSNLFQEALSHWQDVGWSSFQQELDGRVHQMTEEQETSQSARKQLAELTREFRKTVDESIRQQVTPLLKAYQAEIDAASKRQKLADAAYLSCYKRMTDKPDPFPLISTALEQNKQLIQLSGIAEEKDKLQRDFAALQRESSLAKQEMTNLRQQLEKLQKLESQVETTVEERVDQERQKWEQSFNNQLKSYIESERDLRHQLERTRQELAQLKSSQVQVQSQLLQQGQRQEDHVAVATMTHQMLVQDLERVQLHLASVERAKQALEREIEELKVNHTKNETNEWEIKWKQTASQLDQLRQDLMKKEEEFNFQNNIRLRELQQSKQEINQLKEQIYAWRDYEQIKKELDSFLAVEFGSEEKSNLPLDQQLMQQNRRLQSELTDVKVQLDSCQQQFQLVAKEVDSLRSTNQQLKQLNASLEEDLQKQNLSVTSPTANSAPSTASDASLLPIVTSQRDRFRQRMMELEDQVRSLRERVQQLSVENERLQQDSLQLYERLRYMESFKNTSTVSNNNSVMIDLSEDVTHRYKTQYDVANDPMKQFRKKEESRRLQNMNTVDKLTLHLARIMTGNALARRLLIVYVVVLHVLVLLTLARGVHDQPLVVTEHSKPK